MKKHEAIIEVPISEIIKLRETHIDYKHDTGFTADGEFKDGIL